MVESDLKSNTGQHGLLSSGENKTEVEPETDLIDEAVDAAMEAWVGWENPTDLPQLDAPTRQDYRDRFQRNKNTTS